MVSLGVALGLMLMLIRCDLIGYSFWSFLHYKDLWVVLACCYWDLQVVAGSTLAALLLLWTCRGRAGVLRLVRWGYAGFALMTLIFGLVNLGAIGMLGAPVNFPWLYYSDFLTSLDARNAMKEQLTVGKVLGFIGAVLALFLGGRGIRTVVRWCQARGAGRHLLVGSSVVCLVYFAVMVWLYWWGDRNYNKNANPMVALVQSVFTEDQPSIFELPTDVSTADIAVARERQDASVPATGSAADSQVRNVIYFVLESVPHEYVETYGGKYPVTPTIKAMHSRSLSMTAAYSHAPTTSKSIVSSLCSVYPWVSFRVLTKDHPKNNLVSLPKILGQRGYRTAFFNSNDVRFQGGGKFLKGLQFDVVKDYRQRQTNIPGFEDPDGFKMMNSSDDMATTDSLLSWIRERPDQPFFGVVWTMGTHFPYFYRGGLVDYGGTVIYKGKETTKGYKAKDFNRYLNALRHGDRCLAKVLATLDELELTDSTLVVVFGDHGEAFGRHKQWAHAQYIYEENMHVPLIFMHPKLFNGKRDDQLCGLVDIAPTVLDVLGIPTPGEWQGRSLLRDNARQWVFFFAPWTHQLFGYREGHMKYIYRAPRNKGARERFEVYDLAADPRETKNLYKKMPKGTGDRIKRTLASWVQYQGKVMREQVASKR